jgi:hypothetical protein
LLVFTTARFLSQLHTDISVSIALLRHGMKYVLHLLLN